MKTSTPDITQSANKKAPAWVEQSLSRYPDAVRQMLFELRDLILKVHKSDKTLGELSEVHRWNQLSYLTHKPVTGSMIRLGMTKTGEAALFFHCGTQLVDTFRAQYTHLFDFDKNRALIIRQPIKDTEAELSHCIIQALRYKLDR